MRSLFTKSPRAKVRMNGLSPDIEETHRIAVSLGKETYIDPKTGLTVFTSLAAERRGRCCGRGCRHCPYGHFNVTNHEMRRAPLPTKATLLRTSSTVKPFQTGDFLKILFWSGGKDSFLTLLKMIEDDRDGDITLLTTFDSTTGEVPEQNIPITAVFDQAKVLKKDLMVIPGTGSSNGAYIESVISGIRIVENAKKGPVKGETILYFGDLHLRDIREWREKQFAQHNLSCEFPIFGIPYAKLAETMYSEQVKHDYGSKYFFSAINSPAVEFKVGDEITKQVMEEKLLGNQSFDAFGECGEFHTIVQLTRGTA